MPDRLSRDDAQNYTMYQGIGDRTNLFKPCRGCASWDLGPKPGGLSKVVWILYGQNSGFCEQTGALGSLSASSIFRLGDLGQGTYIFMCLSFLIFKMGRMIPPLNEWP